MERILDRFDGGELELYNSPFTFSTLRMYSFWMMSRVSGSIAICPRGLSQLIPFIAAMRVSPLALPLGSSA